MYMYMYVTREHVHVHVNSSYITLIGMHELHGRMHPQLTVA